METWQQVRDWPYEVSDLGRIRSTRTGRIWQPRPNRKGYLWLRLRLNDGQRASRAVHRLVLETFKPSHLAEQVTDHINGDKTDNRLINLEWVTVSENNRRAASRGAYRGEQNGRAKLSEQDVRTLRSLRWQTGQSYSALARLFNISNSQAKRIINGERWQLHGVGSGHGAKVL